MKTNALLKFVHLIFDMIIYSVLYLPNDIGYNLFSGKDEDSLTGRTDSPKLIGTYTLPLSIFHDLWLKKPFLRRFKMKCSSLLCYLAFFTTLGLAFGLALLLGVTLARLPIE